MDAEIKRLMIEYNRLLERWNNAEKAFEDASMDLKLKWLPDLIELNKDLGRTDTQIRKLGVDVKTDEVLHGYSDLN